MEDKIFIGWPLPNEWTLDEGGKSEREKNLIIIF